MITVDFSDMRRGSLFANSFDDVRLYDSNSYQTGEHYYIERRGLLLGIAKLEAIHPFAFSRLHESVSQRLYGKPAHYMASVLRRMYENAEFKITGDTRMMQLVFSWVKRDIGNQAQLLEKFWKEQEENHIPHAEEPQQTLFA